MRVLIGCKRGGHGPRSKSGHCQCEACKNFRKERAREKGKELADYQMKWRSENKEKSASYTRKWNTKNKERRAEIENSWKQKNPEKVKEYNRKAGKKWSGENPGHRRAITALRRAAKIQRTPKWADRKLMTLIYMESAKITSSTGIKHEVDHIFPLQGEIVSGLHVPSNLQILIMSENRSKGVSFNG